MYSRFLLGGIKVDREVVDLLGRTPFDLVARHAVCDYGVVTAEQAKANDTALKDSNGGAEIMSKYLADPTDPSVGTIVITTREGWDITTIKLEKP